jgi:hypothetical protein
MIPHEPGITEGNKFFKESISYSNTEEILLLFSKEQGRVGIREALGFTLGLFLSPATSRCALVWRLTNRAPPRRAMLRSNAMTN